MPYTHSLEFKGGVFDKEPKIPCYRTLDGTGQAIPDAQVSHKVDQQLATKIYTAMAKLQVMDTLFYEAQRQVHGNASSPLPWAAWGVVRARTPCLRRSAVRTAPCRHSTLCSCALCSCTLWHQLTLCTAPSTPQGRFSFYMTSAGEEATVVGSAAGLAAEDVVRWAGVHGHAPGIPGRTQCNKPQYKCSSLPT